MVAEWLGLSEPASSGRSCVRGLSVFPDGHNLKKELRQFLSEGLRAGMVPISDTDVYWFLVNNTIGAGKLTPKRVQSIATDSESTELSFLLPWNTAKLKVIELQRKKPARTP